MQTASSSMPHAAPEGVGKEAQIYANRFSADEEATRNVVWEILCKDFFQQFIKPTDTVLDLGAGQGQFIVNIKCAKKIAVDLQPDSEMFKRNGVISVACSATDLRAYVREPVDLIFMSNFLEHLPTKKVLLELLEECKQALSPHGRIMILQPNIRYVGPAYWDYIDHHIALTEHSLKEALEVTGFKVNKLIPRFLPYTAKSKLGAAVNGGRNDWMIKTYLKYPILWRFFGQQTFVLAERNS